MLINSDGEKEGIVSLDKALESAKKLSLDLVQVSPKGSDKVVCKILDYNKLLFTKKKNTSSSKTVRKKTSSKEIKFRPTTDSADYLVKLNKIKSFILSGVKTKISVRFRGREILNSEMGLNLLNKVSSDLEEIAQIDQEASLEGRQLLMVLSPKKKS